MIIEKALIPVLVVSFVCVFAHGAEAPKNIILMIGDGMGAAHLTGGKIAKGSLSIERMPVGGMVATFAKDKLITDSAAGATAFATGEKTNYGMISVTPEGKPMKTLFEHAEEKGKSTGLAVTCSVTHATPAGFVAHVSSRSSEADIAEYVAGAELEVLFGGGLAYFMPQSMNGSERKDDKNLIDVIARRMQIVTAENQFAGIDVTRPAAALLAMKHPAAADKRELPLKAMVAKAIEILSANEKGFVLMVEGSQIDWNGHSKDGAGVVRETVEFDDAVGVALDYAEKNGNTLVVVTADHETGGMSVTDGSVAEKKMTKAEFQTGGHTAEMVPLFAFGPGANALGGLRDNAEIGRKLIEYVK
jgi:alkaline phosphatase